MNCPLSKICGGCKYRDIDDNEYQEVKTKNFLRTLSSIKSTSYRVNSPHFIGDGSRRRATFAFEFNKKHLILGFNKEASSQIVDVNKCPLLTDNINKVLPKIRSLVEAICNETTTVKQGKKLITQSVNSGDVFVCEASNGIDIVLEFDADLSLSHRMIVSEIIGIDASIIRVSHRRKANEEAETIVEKTKPFIKVGKYEVYIPAGTFLQPSEGGQRALGSLVVQYLKDVKGKVADLFCGVGTFSYLFASNQGLQITAIDSSNQLLKGFQESINKNQISNIKVINKNLFKYPLDSNELKDFSAVVIDPPRAGAKAQCEELAKAQNQPPIIVSISCNPNTFVNDANILIEGGYILQEVTMVDQFIYSNHSELVACFTK